MSMGGEHPAWAQTITQSSMTEWEPVTLDLKLGVGSHMVPVITDQWKSAVQLLTLEKW